MKRALMRGLALLVLALGAVLHGGCGGETEEGKSAGTVPEAFAGVYLVDHPEAAHLNGALILSRKGAFIFCVPPGALNYSQNAIGRWAILADGQLGLTTTHYRWCRLPSLGVSIPGCGSPLSAVVPVWKSRQVAWQAVLEQGGFRTQGASRSTLWIRVPAPAWAVEYMDFTVPESARWGYDPSGKLAGTYTLDRERFAATLRGYDFADPVSLASRATVKLELKSDGTCHWTWNNGWKKKEWRTPRAYFGLWLWHDSHLYFRRADPGVPVDGSYVTEASIVDSRIHLEGLRVEYAKGAATKDQGFDPTYELTRKKP